MMTILMLAVYALAATPRSAQKPAAPPTIVFVCAHGAAKSVIATAYFNKLAEERGLPYRATFRGIEPQADLSERTVEALRADGIVVPPGKPTAIGDKDIDDATHIFAIGCPLPQKARASGKGTDWSDVPEDQGYPSMRDAIVRHVTQLLDDLQAARK